MMLSAPQDAPMALRAAKVGAARAARPEPEAVELGSTSADVC